ncbi:glycine--tRNA ligase subunit beta [Elusimicrobiota bacterium]
MSSVKKITKNSVLLEIGTEEIPSSYIKPVMEQMKVYVEKSLSRHKLEFGEVRVYSTPVRLAVYIQNVESKSPDRTEEMLGPSLKAGKDNNGNFTQAAKGFASKHSIKPDKLKVKNSEKGEYFYIVKNIPGEKAESILTSCFNELIPNLNFPKTMIWEKSGFRFARPIRTLIALYGNKVLKMNIAGVKSGKVTNILHTSIAKKVVIKNPDKYVETLRNNCVLVDNERREKEIESKIGKTVERIKGEIYDKGSAAKALIKEVNYLVEHPVAILGSFDKKYLDLPEEVLIDCLRIKQKCFAVKNEKGLTNNFIGIRNGISEHNSVVQEGYERVLTARLEDAEFFFKKDTSTTLHSKVEKLKGVVFQQKLGTVFDKIQRIKKLSDYISDLAFKSIDKKDISRACDLSKADLVTDMVFEYPELQGVIGRIYAQKDGEKPEVCNAIKEHYHPYGAGGGVPSQELGVVVSLADKFDSLAGYFAIGINSTSSADPYGLRRVSGGIIRLLWNSKINISLAKIVEKAFQGLPQNLNTSDNKNKLAEFFRQRIENFLEQNDFTVYEIQSILSIGFDDIFDIRKRINAQLKMLKSEDFSDLAGAFKRASNILKQAEKSSLKFSNIPDRSLFETEEETSLFDDIQKIEKETQLLINEGDYEKALESIVAIKPSIDSFFDKVMVMVENEPVKLNRLSLLKYSLKPSSRILDFSFLSGFDRVVAKLIDK